MWQPALPSAVLALRIRQLSSMLPDLALGIRQLGFHHGGAILVLGVVVPDCIVHVNTHSCTFALDMGFQSLIGFNSF